jgi:hypothetical protein
MFSLVNFDSINALGQGEYYAGFRAQCPVAEDFTKQMEDPTEPLLSAALRHLQGLGCPASASSNRSPMARSRAERALGFDGPEVPGLMLN